MLLSVDQGLTFKYWSKVFCRDSFSVFHASKLWV